MTLNSELLQSAREYQNATGFPMAECVLLAIEEDEFYRFQNTPRSDDSDIDD